MVPLGVCMDKEGLYTGEMDGSMDVFKTLYTPFVLSEEYQAG